MRAGAVAWAVAVASIACSHAARPRVFSPADDAAIRAVLAQQRDAWNRGDLSGYMAGYARTDRLVFTSGAQIRRGWKATHARYRARYGKQPGAMGTLSFEVLQVQPLGADGAVVLGRWRLTNTPSAGDGVFSVVFERRANGWYIVHDHTSVTPRAPASKRPGGGQ